MLKLTLESVNKTKERTVFMLDTSWQYVYYSSVPWKYLWFMRLSYRDMSTPSRPTVFLPLCSLNFEKQKSDGCSEMVH